jgi:hypothetical protein
MTPPYDLERLLEGNVDGMSVAELRVEVDALRGLAIALCELIDRLVPADELDSASQHHGCTGVGADLSSSFRLSENF